MGHFKLESRSHMLRNNPDAFFLSKKALEHMREKAQKHFSFFQNLSLLMFPLDFWLTLVM